MKPSFYTRTIHVLGIGGVAPEPTYGLLGPGAYDLIKYGKLVYRGPPKQEVGISLSIDGGYVFHPVGGFIPGVTLIIKPFIDGALPTFYTIMGYMPRFKYSDKFLIFDAEFYREMEVKAVRDIPMDLIIGAVIHKNMYEEIGYWCKNRLYKWACDETFEFLDFVKSNFKIYDEVPRTQLVDAVYNGYKEIEKFYEKLCEELSRTSFTPTSEKDVIKCYSLRTMTTEILMRVERPYIEAVGRHFGISEVEVERASDTCNQMFCERKRRLDAVEVV